MQLHNEKPINKNKKKGVFEIRQIAFDRARATGARLRPTALVPTPAVCLMVAAARTTTRRR